MADPLLWILVLVAGAAAAGGLYSFRRLRARRVAAVFHFNCPHCGRRFGYRAQQCGHPGQCRHCGRRFTFPASPGAPLAQGR
jgi:predicted RNA-binding Zn-ribbon protein involved in translation (DUF1610 family)